jgi:hypothetical protein
MGNILNGNVHLNFDEKITSQNGRYFLIMQNDSNLVMYNNQNQAIWASGTNGSGATFAIMQTDGNLVLYRNDNSPVWASNTDGHPNSILVLQDDRNLVIYDDGNPIWASGTNIPNEPSGSLRLNFDEKITSQNGRYFLIMQNDSNLVMYNNQNQAIWATGTNGTGATYAIMQTDGNLVVYRNDNSPVWASNTDGHPNSVLVLQDDRNLVIYDNGNPIWASGTNIPNEPSGSLRLNFDEKITSQNGRYFLIMQNDSNLVMYDNQNQSIWATGTNGSGATYAIMQTDGNLVLYRNDNSPVWASNTDGHPNSVLVLQDDRNLVIYDDGNPIWATGTNIPNEPSGSLRLNFDEKITSQNGRYFLIMQNDSNLVMYDNQNQAIWATGTNGSGATYAIMQTDGNLVLYRNDNSPVWASNTDGHPNSILVLQDDRNLVIYDDGNPIWASGTNISGTTIINDNNVILKYDIITSGLNAFGGWVEITINRNGDVNFKGHVHNSGLENYDFNIRVVIHSDSPIVLAMQKSGSVEGTIHSGLFDAPRRDFDWNETIFNQNVASKYEEIINNIQIEVNSNNEGSISSTLEEIADFAIKWVVGSILVNPISGLIIFIGIEVGSVISGAGFVGGARVIGSTLWLAGPFGTLYALAAEGIASIGENERELTEEEYNYANQVFKGTLPSKSDIILTDTIGGNNRAFTMPRFDKKITVNMGVNSFNNPLLHEVGLFNSEESIVIKYGQVFIHELTHAWQIKNTNWSIGLLASALSSKVCETLGGHPYQFLNEPKKPFSEYNLEQQASIVDYWFASCNFNNNNLIIGELGNTTSPWFQYIEENIRTGQV